MPKSYEEELRACQRYYEKSYSQGVNPATSTYDGCVNANSIRLSATDTRLGPVFYKVEKRTRISPVIYSITAPAAAKVEKYGGTAYNGSAVTYGNSAFSVYSGDDTVANSNFFFQWTVDAEL